MLIKTNNLMQNLPNAKKLNHNDYHLLKLTLKLGRTYTEIIIN